MSHTHTELPPGPGPLSNLSLIPTRQTLPGRQSEQRSLAERQGSLWTRHAKALYSAQTLVASIDSLSARPGYVELELELTQSHMAQKPVLRGEDVRFEDVRFDSLAMSDGWV